MTPPTTEYQGTNPAGRIWFNLGTPNTVRVIFVAMIAYFLVLGGLVLGYTNVQQCLATYSDASAASTKARAEAAAIDRKLNARIDELSTSERARLRSDQVALLELVTVLSQGRNVDSSAVQVALDKVKQTNEDSVAIGKVNDRERYAIEQERARADALRTLNPVPEAPSEKC